MAGYKIIHGKHKGGIKWTSPEYTRVYSGQWYVYSRLLHWDYSSFCVPNMTNDLAADELKEQKGYQ